MKKILIIAFVPIVTLTGCSWGQKQAAEQAADQQPAMQEVREEAKKLSDWLTSGQSVVCTVAIGGGETTYKVKNGKVRMDTSFTLANAEGMNQTKITSSITDGNWVYAWSDGQGTKMDIQKMKELEATSAEEAKPENQETWEDMARNYEAANFVFNCEEQDLADDLFVPPTDINFTDMSQVMENMQNFGQDLQDKIDAGENVNQEDIEARLNEAMEGVNIPQ